MARIGMKIALAAIWRHGKSKNLAERPGIERE